MAGILTVDTIQSDSSYASTLNVASKINFTSGMQIGGQDTTFGGMRNRIINGAMNIAQRNTSVSGITSTYDNYPAIDRFLHYQETTSAVCTVAQVADAPAGFVNSLKITVTTADASVAAGDRINIAHKIEGLNLLDFDFGLSTAKSFTVSFWVKSSVTGTYALEIYNYGISTASTATKTYTINSANTWEYKTVTFTGDTVYPHVKTNGASLAVWMWLMAGSNYNSTNGGGVFTAVGSGTQRAYGQTANIAATVNNTFQMTGMQLETGSAASPFEYRQYGTELALCQRYYELFGHGGAGKAGSGTVNAEMAHTFQVTKRVAPSILYVGSVSNTVLTECGVATRYVASIAGTSTGTTGAYVNAQTSVNGSGGVVISFPAGVAPWLSASAEL